MAAMFKRFLSGVLVLTIIVGFAQNPFSPNNIQASSIVTIPPFSPGTVCPTGSYPISVAAADLNGDSSSDIIVANFLSYTVSVLLNKGRGTFAPKVDYPTGTLPISIAAADLNGDSRPDIIVANLGSNTVSVLLNNGNGTFAPKVDYDTRTGPRSVIAADINGDSRPDIIVANGGSNSVSVLLNNGNGTFAPKVDYWTGSYPISVAVVDLNSDARPELIVANYSSNTMSVLSNNGDGTFAPKMDYPTGTSPYSVTTIDLNGDTHPDVAVANRGSNTVSVRLNSGTGILLSKVDYTTGSSPILVAAVELSGDSRPDLAVMNSNSNTVSVLLNNGSGSFAPKVDYPTGIGPFSVAAADLNGDSSPDIIVANCSSNTVSVLLTAVNLSLSPASSNVIVGTTFDVIIQADAGAIGVLGVDVFLNFDPTRLAVVDMDGGTTGIQITPGTALNTVLTNSSDNALGTITFGAGKMSAPFPSGTFTVATIRFQALAVTTPTTVVSFATIGARKTSVTNGFSDVTGTLTGATIQIIPPGANVNISVLLQGGSRPDSGWIIPLTVKLFAPGANVMTAPSVYTFNLTAAKSGGYANLQCTGVIPGIYDITSVSEHTLLNVRRNVMILATSNMVNMGTLLEGNANNDDRVNIQDFGLLVVSYGRGKGQSGYNAMADFDRNDNVNIFDFGLLAMNYLKIAPIEVTGPPTIPGGKLLISPKDGVTIYSNTMQIQLDYANFRIVPRSASNKVGEGHINFYLDVDPIPIEKGKPAILPSPTPAGYKGKIYIGDTSTVAQIQGYIWQNIPNGIHTIGVQLVNNDNTPLDPPMWDKASITINGPYPSGTPTYPPPSTKPVVVRPPLTGPPTVPGGKLLIAPKEGTEIFSNTLQIQLDYANFYIMARTRPNAVGEGHINFYMDVEPIPTEKGKPAILPSPTPAGYKGKLYIGDTSTVEQIQGYIWRNIPNGKHTIAVQLVNNDNTPLDPPMWDKATITINGPYPSGVNPSPEPTSKPTIVKPTITSFTPTSGGIGTKIVITGKGYTSAPVAIVKVGDLVIPVSDYKIDSDTQITVTLSSVGTSGKISITTASGVVNSADTFTFN
jgi:hypothetical protein